jgi:hypothetical protein
MIQSFNSWNQVNESLAKGKEKYLNPVSGKKAKITFRVQTAKQFVMKLINYDDVIDSTNKLTQPGIDSLTSFLNSEEAFVRTIGQITPEFFKTRFIVYTILRDGEILGRSKQKIQFLIEYRNDAAGNPMHSNVPQDATFIDSETFKKLSEKAQPLVNSILQTGQNTTLPDPRPDDAQPTGEKTDYVGKKFLYSMRSNNTLYMMVFSDSLTLTATVKAGGDPNGTVSYSESDKKIVWNTSLDDESQNKGVALSRRLQAPLFHDMEIVNTFDKSFFQKLFTDTAFRDKILEEYEREYGGSELTAENLRKMLYYKNGELIFGTPQSAEGGSEALTKDDAARIKKAADDIQRAAAGQQLENNSYSQVYRNYMNMFEQSAVLSDDLNTKLKQYLDNDELLKKLASILNSYESGDYQLSSIDNEEFGIKSDDLLFVKVNKADKFNPKFFMWILNDEFLYGDVNLEIAATLLNAAGKGWGTDEESFAAVAGAIIQTADEKSVDPELYFDKLDEIFKTKHGKSIAAFIDEEFDGYAETVALNAFRRKIEPSTLRGMNFWTIASDVVLTLSGVGGIAKALGKGAQAASASSKALKYSGGAGKAAQATGRIAKLKNAWNASSSAVKLKRLQTVYRPGTSIQYISKAGKTISGTVSGYKTGGAGAKMTIAMQNGAKFDILVANLTTVNAGLPGYISKMSMNRLVPVGAAAALGSRLDSAGSGEKFSEIMGWYDNLAADPNAFINTTKNQGAQDLASMLLEFKQGSGFFGNTTNQEECAMALLITGLSPEMAKEVSAEYKKIDKETVYAVLDDELGGDQAIFAKTYWTACTGEGDKYKPYIKNTFDRIRQK